MLIDDPHSPGLARLIERVSPEQARDDLDDAQRRVRELNGDMGFSDFACSRQTRRRLERKGRQDAGFVAALGVAKKEVQFRERALARA